MMKKTKTPKWLLRLLGVICLFVNLAACDSTEGTVESEPNKPKPEVPVADGDWQTVPATGGTITKDSISIIFPSGTFSEDTKVAISEVNASDVVEGEEARSKFYQIMLPATGTLKPFTIKLKCERATDDIDMIARMPGWNTETGVYALNNFHLKTSVSGDFVSTTIPLMRSDGQEKPFFTIGLADGEIASGNETRETSTRASNPYRYRLRWNTLGLRLKYRILTLDKSIENLFFVNLPKAIKGLQELKFEFPEDEIPFVFREIEGETWGNWITSKWSSIGEIELNVRYFSRLAQNTTDTNLAKELQKTLVHESTHALQSMVYDPRWVYPLKNISENLGEDWSSASEAIGSWSEKIIDGEHIGHNSTNQEGKANVREFMKGFFPRYWTGTIYNNHGYGMGVFIEYLASKAGKDKIVELYKLQKEGKTFMDALKSFLSTHKISFFTTEDYYKFAFKVINREIEEYVDFMTVYNSYNVEEKDETYIVKDTAFNYGIAVNEIFLRKNYLKKHEKKEIRLTEKNNGVKTYVYYYNKNSKLKELGVLTKDNPYIISIEQLCKLKEVDDLNNVGYGIGAFVLVSTREKNYEYSNTLIDRLAYMFTLTEETGALSEIVVDLTEASVEPDELEFPAKGDTKKVIVNYGTYKYFGYKIENKDTTWIKAVTDKTDGIGVKFTVTPNTTTSPRETTVYCFVANVKESTDADRVYMPVKITQKAGAAPSVTPEKLTFEASGGTQSVKVTAQGYKRFGYNIPQEYTSWLKGKAISGGTVEITAQPNDTGKERTATIKCFVTNVDNATDDQKVFMPVTIVQKAKSQPSTFRIETISLYFDYNDGVTEWAPYRSGKNWNGNNIAISGGHVTCSWKSTTNNSYSELSFDIDDVNKLESKAARISNIKGEGKTYYDDGRLVDLWKISADCQTTNSSSSEDDITYYGWSWGKNSFYEFSGGGVAWVATVEHPTVLSKMVDAYGSISIKIAK